MEAWWRRLPWLAVMKAGRASGQTGPARWLAGEPEARKTGAAFTGSNAALALWGVPGEVRERSSRRKGHFEAFALGRAFGSGRGGGAEAEGLAANAGRVWNAQSAVRFDACGKSDRVSRRASVRPQLPRVQAYEE